MLPLDRTLPDTPEASSLGITGVTKGRGRLLQVLGMWFGISAAIGNAISAGIVRTPGDIARGLPNAWLFLAVWIVGGLYALFSAPSMAELGAAIPRSGGQYNFSRRAIGEYAGFIVGWSDWLSTCGTAAAVAIVVSEYSGSLFPILAGPQKIKLLSVTIIVGFGVLQWRGIRWGSGAQLLTAAIKTAGFLVLVLACFLKGGQAHQAALHNNAPPPTLASGWPLAVAIMLGLQAVFYTIDGWDGVIYFGEEVREPGRDVPRAIFGSVFSIMGIYLLLNLVALYVLPMNEIAGNNFVLGAFERVIAMLSFFFVANYTLTYASLFVLRKREPEMHRPYRAWGYPWTMAIALGASVLFLIGSIAPDLRGVILTGRFWPPSPAMLALMILILSYPVFRVLKRVKLRAGAKPTTAS